VIDEFVWPLNKAGYEISKHHFVQEAYLGEFLGESGSPETEWIRPLGGGRRSHRYAPLRGNTALFRTFVDLDGGPQSIVDFANRFGLLTNPEEGEPLALWEAAVAEMRSAVKNWEHVAVSIDGIDEPREVVGTSGEAKPAREACDVDVRGDAGIGKTRVPARIGGAPQPARTDSDVLLRPVGESGKAFAGSYKAVTPTRPAHDIDALTLAGHSGDVMTYEEAFAEIWKALASQLNKNISPVRIVFHHDKIVDGLIAELMPANLLEAMWLQFGHAVESNKSFRKCRECGTWFEVSPKKARSDKVFCSGACKAKAYRTRHFRHFI
jgi:hypothetical protein